MKQLLFIGLATMIFMGSCNSNLQKRTENTSSEKDTFPTITSEGIGDLKVKSPLSECFIISNTYADTPTEKELCTNDEKKFGFYNRTGIQYISCFETIPYITLYNDNELMAAIKSYSLASNSINSSNVDRIIVYSPKLKMTNGIHVGMSAKELVEKYGAEIQYTQGVEYDALTFQIENIASNITLEATADSIKSNKMDSGNEIGITFTDFFLQLSEVENCKLSAIVINQKSEIYYDSY